MTSQVAYQAQTFTTTQVVPVVPVSSATYPNYPAKAAKSLGIVQIIIGITCIFFNCFLVSHEFRVEFGFGYVGTGFWCGVMFIITGSLAVASGKNKNRCLIISVLVMSIITSLFGAIMFIMGTMGLIVAGIVTNYGYLDEDTEKAGQGMAILLTVLGFVEGVICIIQAALCCSPMCCQNGQQQMAVQYVQNPDGTCVAVAMPVGAPQGTIMIQQPGTSTVAYPQAQAAYPQAQAPYDQHPEKGPLPPGNEMPPPYSMAP